MKAKVLKAKVLWSLTLTTTVMLVMVAASRATVPPPPVNQIIGLPDGVFNDLVEAGCRACHEDPNIVNPGTLPDRHHLLVGEVIIDPTAAPHGTPGDIYECLSCHELQYDSDTGGYVLVSFRDCLLCHQQIPGEASVHHMTAKAEEQDCKACHGPIDNPLDGHYIPDYPVSMVTPYPGLGTGVDGKGGCAFCHAEGTDDATGIPVFDNSVTHHSTGIGWGVIPGSQLGCSLCHDMNSPAPANVRRCEVCHGVNSLHNIQADSDGNGVNPGEEEPWYGHIGNNIDCNGCHANAPIVASILPASPIIPNISGLSRSTVTAGVETSVTITGSVFINGVYSSVVSLTAFDCTETTLTPLEISGTSMVVTIPADLACGNYAVRAVKETQVSNCVNISLVPDVVITSVDRGIGTATIAGSGFCDYVNATDSGTGVFMTTTKTIGKGRRATTVTTTEPCPVASWNDTEIVVECGTSSGTIEVYSVYGSTSIDVVGDEPVRPVKRPRKR
ncbi:MAG: hypothetical protein U9N60_01660 [Thermodesulfobacteriota bacterium]|nr:hypothetical protein [Thermodesulfobacteriota bacterium]